MSPDPQLGWILVSSSSEFVLIIDRGVGGCSDPACGFAPKISNTPSSGTSAWYLNLFREVCGHGLETCAQNETAQLLLLSLMASVCLHRTCGSPCDKSHGAVRDRWMSEQPAASAIWIRSLILQGQHHIHLTPCQP
ncbi:hypothetical protein XENORESO_013833 [Xenotaenia resolanae]|uniref:Uncharacterized protein n=1 Tax=Xenotaenia resolanae TaxID=208358 RepID=A0ABV0W8H5_9TELE